MGRAKRRYLATIRSLDSLFAGHNVNNLSRIGKVSDSDSRTGPPELYCRRLNHEKSSQLSER
jgi:hypothetical protein